MGNLMWAGMNHFLRIVPIVSAAQIREFAQRATISASHKLRKRIPSQFCTHSQTRCFDAFSSLNLFDELPIGSIAPAVAGDVLRRLCRTKRIWAKVRNCVWSSSGKFLETKRIELVSCVADLRFQTRGLLDPVGDLKAFDDGVASSDNCGGFVGEHPGRVHGLGIRMKLLKHQFCRAAVGPRQIDGALMFGKPF